MSSIEEALEDPSFVPFTVAGYPDVERSKEMVRALIDSGADVVELGVPFSDPMADGPTIKEADHAALQAGTTVDEVFEISSEFGDTPIVLLAYANTVYSYGYQEFVDDADSAGVEGLIIPDMPPGEFREEFSDVDSPLDHIFLVSQNTPEERIETIGEMTEGFAYLVSVKGTTGARDEFSSKSRGLVEKTEGMDVPRCIGFGISGPEQARTAIDSGADGVIMGSALIDRYREDGPEGMRELAEKVSSAVEGDGDDF
ncbi:MAG: tryptophan synthase subunit alpha [Candidatus Nanohaloarchaea archaeon]